MGFTEAEQRDLLFNMVKAHGSLSVRRVTTIFSAATNLSRRQADNAIQAALARGDLRQDGEMLSAASFVAGRYDLLPVR